ncbi:oxidoreductase C-terminal domain-containing protein [Streptomyces sp. NPDC004051]
MQSVKGAASVPAATRGYDGGKKVNGRKRHIVVDTLGLLLAVTVTAASVSGRDLPARFGERHRRITRVWADGGYTGQSLESVQNATEQAKAVASDLLGDPRPYRVVPWFWSNQYDVKLKTVGVFTGHDTVILRGDPADGAFTTVCLAQGRVIALDCVDTAADFAQGKVLVDRSMEIDPRRTGRHVKAVAVLPGLPTAGSHTADRGRARCPAATSYVLFRLRATPSGPPTPGRRRAARVWSHAGRNQTEMAGQPIDFVSRNSAKADSPNSRPKPLCLKPP